MTNKHSKHIYTFIGMVITIVVATLALTLQTVAQSEPVPQGTAVAQGGAVATRAAATAQAVQVNAQATVQAGQTQAAESVQWYVPYKIDIKSVS